MLLKSYKGNLEACDAFGKPLLLGADIIYARVDLRRPEIHTGIVLNVDLEKGVQVSFNDWKERPKPGKNYSSNDPEDFIREERVVTVWLKTFDCYSKLEPGKAIFRQIYQIN